MHRSYISSKTSFTVKFSFIYNHRISIHVLCLTRSQNEKIILHFPVTIQPSGQTSHVNSIGPHDNYEAKALMSRNERKETFVVQSPHVTPQWLPTTPKALTLASVNLHFPHSCACSRRLITWTCFIAQALASGRAWLPINYLVMTRQKSLIFALWPIRLTITNPFLPDGSGAQNPDQNNSNSQKNR